MDSTSAAETSAEPQVVFRPSKKRKQFRQRAEANNDDDDSKAASNTTTTTTTTADPPTAAATTTSETATTQTAAPSAQTKDSDAARENDETSETERGLSVAEALRLRNARKARLLKGVGFRPEGPPQATAFEEANENEGQHKDDVAEALELGVSRRFAPQAGLVGELVNKHMEEYIESELARRHAADKAAQDAAALAASQSSPRTATSLAALKQPKDRPTMSGRLQEVDLGEEARARNAAMTEQARRRLAGEAPADESEGRRPPRLGKDGKPWRPRKRRASEDIKRDQLVEELMRENKLDVYDVPAQPDASEDAGEDEAADEKIAAKFKREFMDAMAERRQARRRAAAPSAQKARAAKSDDILRGPKLGGSRNARAAMRDILLSQQQSAKKRR